LIYRISLWAGDRALQQQWGQTWSPLRLTMGLMIGTTCLYRNFAFTLVVKGQRCRYV